MSSILKFILPVLVSLLTIFLLELTSSVILSIKADNGKELFLKRFPVQFRLSENVLGHLVGVNQVHTTESRDFFFDPVLNYRSENWLTLYTLNENIKLTNQNFYSEVAKYKNAKWIVTLGGSTTSSAQPTNWPSHLLSELQKKGQSNVVVLNAGHNGYGLSQQYIYFLYHIYPNLKKINVKISTLISLDGVNEISLGIAPIINKQLKGVAYTPLYSGYSSIIERNYSNFFEGDDTRYQKNLLASMSKKLLYGFFPATATLLSNRRSEAPSPLFSFIDSYKKFNILFFDGTYIAIPQNYGPVNIDNLMELSGDVVYDHNIANILIRIDAGSRNSTANMNPISPRKELSSKINNQRNFDAIKTVELDLDEKKIISLSAAVHLDNFDSHAVGSGYRNYHYLQPAILEPTVNDKLPRDIPSLDYILVHWFMRGSELGLPVRFNSREIYEELRAIYRSQNRIDISAIFDTSSKDKAKLMTFDNIHYTLEGSQLIAKGIITNCWLVKKCGLE